MSTLNVSKVQHESGAGDNINLDASGNVDVAGNVVATGDVQMASQNGGQLAGFRNRLIGNFFVWQRGTTFNNPADVSYTADRWQVRDAQGGSLTVSQFLSGNAPKLRCNYTGNTGGGYIRQFIEASNIRDLANTEVTMSVFSSGAAVTMTLTVYTYDESDTSVKIVDGVTMDNNKTSDTAAGKHWHTFTLPNQTYGTDLNSRGLLVVLVPKAAGGASALGDATVDYWYPQLEPGPVATPFENRPIGTELALCQRYYQTIHRIRLAVENTGSSGNPANGNATFNTAMRTAPTSSMGFSNCTERSVDVSPEAMTIRVLGDTTNSVMSVNTIILNAEL